MHLFDEHAKAGTIKDLTIKKMSDITAIKVEDILSTLQTLNMILYWKGQHVLHIQRDVVVNYIKKTKPIRLCKSECLHWPRLPTKGG